MTDLLYYGALTLGAYATFQRGWWWTPSTSRRRDFAGFVAVIVFAWLLAQALAVVS